MTVITSKDNELIKRVRKLKDKKYRDEENVFVVEGVKMIEEALQENQTIQKIFICEECVKDGSIDQKFIYEIAKQDCVYVTEKIFNTMTELQSPQGILAVIEKNEKNEKISFSDEIYLVLDGIQDPGNLGTIIRTADSTGVKQIILSDKCADPYNPKVIRSTMGAIFRVNLFEQKELLKCLKEFQKHQYKISATCLDEAVTIYETDYTKKVIVIGNEANGVSNEILQMADEKIKIPMLGKTESLNASVATGIILYEAVRQKLEKENGK